MQLLTLCLDPGHGNHNKRRNQYDPGYVIKADGQKYEEAAIAMAYVNCLRDVLRAQGHTVIRTRRDALDPAPVSRRDDIARAYKCSRMVSIHCNMFNGRASGTEVFFRGEDDRARARLLSDRVANALAIPNRGPKTEKDSQHKSLAIMEFEKCWLIELGFLDNPRDRAAILDPNRMAAVCRAIAQTLTD